MRSAASACMSGVTLTLAMFIERSDDGGVNGDSAPGRFRLWLGLDHRLAPLQPDRLVHAERVVCEVDIPPT